MKEICVSICISVHNTEELLPRCLDSVVNQTLSPIEIVLVNNGSTDNSLEIMEKYKSEYPNIAILIISQEDKGVAQGRQTGVNYAHGSYIAFLDADDYVLPDAYEKMYKAAILNNADIVESESITGGFVKGSIYSDLQDSDRLFRDLLTSRNPIRSVLWLRMFRKNLFNEGVFPSFYTNNEDKFALPCLFYRAKRVYFMKEVLYVHCQDNKNSAMNIASRKKDSKKELRRLKVLLKTIKHVWKYVGKDDIIQNYNEEIKAFTAAAIARFICSDYIDLSYSERMVVIREELAYFDTKRVRDIELFVKEHIVPSCKLYRCIKIFGLKFAFLIFSLSGRYRNKLKEV